MTEFITYTTNYFEHLIPNSDFKLTVYSDGSGRVEDMSDSRGGIVFSNGNTLRAEARRLKDMEEGKEYYKWCSNFYNDLLNDTENKLDEAEATNRSQTEFIIALTKRYDKLLAAFKQQFAIGEDMLDELEEEV